MKREIWAEILTRITGERPLDLDGPVFGHPQAQADVTGSTARSGGGENDILRPSARLLHTREAGSASIGIRLTRPLQDPAGLALHLAAMAVQKGVDPVILSAIGRTGFERWGFRVERLPADPAARALAEAEIAAFWGIAVILDAEDVARLG
ncbi:MAG: hypothetical protein ACOY4T_00990 [Pseudomonadota bacterium]|jgi:hypothetical protein